MPLLRTWRATTLFGKVLDWMLVPIVLLWAAALVGSYLAATVIAENTYDLRLRDIVQATAEEVRSRERDILENRRLPVLNSLRDDPVDRFYVQLAHESGELMQGDADIPPVGRRAPRAAGEVRFRDTYLEVEDESDAPGDGVRVAYMAVTMASGNLYVVQVAEPLSRRLSLVREVTVIVMIVISLMIPGMAAMAWFGLKLGLSPLLRLRDRVEARDPDDLSPIPPGDVPLEIAPLVNTLNRQLERVRVNLDAQRRFVADAAHQMRTPLAGLKTQAEAASRASSLEDARARLARIQEGAERLGRLMAQLLALARADDALASPARREPCDLNELLREESARWADSAIVKGVNFGFDAAPGPAMVHGAPLLLREMFSNLIDNAIRYTPVGGEVSVIVSGAPRPTVVVEDSGIGIAPVERPLVFERFYRVLGTGESGSGLGLSIVKAIADQHGAQVRVEAGADGVGARFVVTFEGEG